MAFKTAETASEAFFRAKNIARDIKAQAQSYIAMFASTTSRTTVLGMVEQLRGYRVALAGASSVSGVLQFAKDQYDDQAYNVAAEFTAVLNAIDAVIAQVVSDFPVDNSGGELKEKLLAVDGAVTARTFTAAQLATVVSLLQTLDNAISF